MAKRTRIENTIRLMRFTHGEMTQAELGKRVGLTRQTIAAIEKGRYSPSLEVAFEIADVFDLSVDKVFFRPGTNDAQITE